MSMVPTPLALNSALQLAESQIHIPRIPVSLAEWKLNCSFGLSSLSLHSLSRALSLITLSLLAVYVCAAGSGEHSSVLGLQNLKCLGWCGVARESLV